MLRLIIGLGNPGTEYEETRHNIGFMVVKRLANLLGASFKQERQFASQLAKGQAEGNLFWMLLPMTYMNLSGQAVRMVMDFYKLKPEEIVVVHDDVAIDFGQMRLKEQGGSGGHNGLANIQAHLGTANYLRLRIGIGNKRLGSLEGHVLGRFSQEEKAALPAILDEAGQLLRRLLSGEAVSRLMNDANARKKDQNQTKIDQAEKRLSTDSGVGEKK